MLTPYPDLFLWWVISISWGIVFLITVSIFLYAKSRTSLKKSDQVSANRIGIGKDLVFVWVLLGLLVLYIVSINRGSAPLFAVGNIIVEVILIIYLLKNKEGKIRVKAG